MDNQQNTDTELYRDIFLHNLNRLYFGKKLLDGKMEELVEQASLPNLQLALAEMWDDVKNQICKMGEIYKLVKSEPADENSNPIKTIIKDEFCLSQLAASALQNDLDLILYVELLEHINITSYRMLKTLAHTFKNQEINQLLIECFDESVDDDRLFVMVTEEYTGEK